jgi:hypothetical protein
LTPVLKGAAHEAQVVMRYIAAQPLNKLREVM